MEVLRVTIHYSLHLIFPGVIAFFFFKANWKKAWFLMVLTMMIDLDHLLASSIFDSNRCSINFHPLHTYMAALVYMLLLFFPYTRVISIALLLHLFTDWMDCLWL